MTRAKQLLLALALFPLALLPRAGSASEPPIATVHTVGMTVSNMERSLAFYTEVLRFEKVSDVEVEGPSYERLEGLPGARMRVVEMRLGEERVALTEY